MTQERTINSTLPGNDGRKIAGHPDRRSFVGPPDRYDLTSAGQFNLLTALGLRERHSLLDIGCGSLRAGRFFIMYLAPGNYCGIEPEQWLIDEGIDAEVGRSLAEIKKPSFSNDSNFTLTTFGRKFDFLLAQSIFSHAAPTQIRRCLSEAKKVLQPDGIFAATYFAGQQNYQGAEWVYPGCVYYQPGYLESLAAEVGLRGQSIHWTHSNQQTWLAFTHQDQSVAIPDPADTARLHVLEHELDSARRQLQQLRGLHGFKLLKKINRFVSGRQK